MAKARTYTPETEWPHANSELVIERTGEFVKRTGVWPNWPSHPWQVAGALIRRGALSAAEIAEAGGPDLREKVAGKGGLDV